MTSTLPPDEHRPVILLLHGLGSHEGDLAALTGFLPEDFDYVALRGILAHGPGYAWFEMPVDPDRPEAITPAAEAVEGWIAEQDRRVVGAIGFSQGGLLALHLLRRDARALDFVVNLSGRPFPAPMRGDDALADVRPPVFWGHGGLDPLFDTAAEDEVRAFMTAHTALEEVHRPYLGHGIDQEELAAIAGFVGRMLASTPEH